MAGVRRVFATPRSQVGPWLGWSAAGRRVRDVVLRTSGGVAMAAAWRHAARGGLGACRTFPPFQSRTHPAPQLPPRHPNLTWHPPCFLFLLASCLPACCRGYYADIPFVSESVYHQVKFSEFA